MKSMSVDVRKTVATIVVAVFFIFFWINGPLSGSIEIVSERNENLELVKPVLVSDQSEEKMTFNTIDEMDTGGDGFNMILDLPEDTLTSFSILNEGSKTLISSDYGKELLRNAKKFFEGDAQISLEQTEDFYYATIDASDHYYYYFQSKGIADEIKGYSGPINVGLIIREDGYLHKMIHVSSAETESYLKKIAKTHYYDQYDHLSMDRLHDLDGISGATISSKAMANTTSEMVNHLYPFPLTDLVDRNGMNEFQTQANLSWAWIPQVILIFILFLYAFQKKLRKSKRYVMLASIASMLFIGFYLNDSFTYITFMHPFIGTSLSSFMGIYAVFVLLGAIWGKNTYCKYICPYGNVQRLQLKLWKGVGAKFPLSNKWIKRIRFAILIFLIAGILAGFRNLSHLEPYPYLFGLEIQSIWYFSFAILALVMNWVYPLIWCRLLCPTGSVLDSISFLTEKSKKKKPVAVRRVVTVTAAIAFFLMPQIGFSQQEIHISDQTGNPIPFAKFYAYNLSDSTIFFSESDEDGVIEFNSIAGEWAVCVRSINHEGWADTVDISSLKTIVLKRIQVIDEMVVTAQHQATTVEKAVQKIKIISAEQIQQSGSNNLADVLSYQTGIRISQDNILGSGMDLGGISGQNVKILIDGVPIIGRQNGNIDLSQINLANIERIEIVEGPLSVNYGTNALAGTINLITKKKGKKGLEVMVNPYYETIGNYNLSANVALNSKHHRLAIDGYRNYFDGWSDGDPFIEFPKEKLADTNRYKTWKPKEQYSFGARYSFRKKTITTSVYGQFFNEMIVNRGFPNQPYYETAFDDYYHTQRKDLGVDFQKSFNISRLTALAAFNDYNRIKNTYYKDLTTLDQVLSQTNGAQDSSRFTQFVGRVNYYGSIGKKLNYQAGIDINHNEGWGRRIEDRHRAIGDYAGFVTADWKVMDSLTIKTGVRYAYNTAFDSPLIPSFNILYRRKHFSYRASVAKGFRAPDLKELYMDFVDVNHNIRGNSDLQAEESVNTNLFINWMKQGKKNRLFKAEYGAFYNQIQDLITLGIVNNNEYTYINIGEYSTIGNQLELTYRSKKWNLIFNTTYIGRYNPENETEDVERYTFSPEFSVRSNYKFLKERLQFNTFYKFNGKLQSFNVSDTGDVSTSIQSSYHILDASISSDFLDKQLTVVLGAKNLLNVKQVNVIGQSSGVHSSSSNLNAARGMSLFLSLRYQLNVKLKS